MSKRKIKISEIYFSIQGESSCAGLPCIFVRTAGCNLDCSYCDTAYAREEGRETTVDEILEKVESFPGRLVQITGGEPLIQPAVPELAAELTRNLYTVLLETNGSVDISGVPPGVVKIIDIKCPGSGMAGRSLADNLKYLNPKDELKFVITGREDFDWAVRFMKEKNLFDRAALNMSPAFGVLEPKELAEWILEEGLPVKLNLQLHKYIWEPDARGV